MKYKRVLLKLSGEALASKEDIYDNNVLNNILEQVTFLVKEQNVQLAIVIGGGNIWRGEISQKIGIDPIKADYMGMMATTINALALASFFNENNLDAQVVNSLSFEDIATNLDPKQSINLLEAGKVVIFGGGTGKPLFSTDTAASMRAKQIKAEAILVAKNNTDGVFDKDPNKYSDAKFYPEITYKEILDQGLRVVDPESLKILADEHIDLIIFNMNKKDFIKNLYNNKYRKTIVRKN